MRENMRTMSLRVTDDERARLDALAELLTGVDHGTGWWGSKRGRGDVLRLAMQLLEERVAGDGATSPAGMAERSLYRTHMRVDERVTALQVAAAAAAPAEQIDGQMDVYDAGAGAA